MGLCRARHVGERKETLHPLGERPALGLTYTRAAEAFPRVPVYPTRDSPYETSRRDNHGNDSTARG